MGIHLELVNFEALLCNSIIEPVIVNSFDVRDEDNIEKINRILLTTYTSDSLEVAPTCECGSIKGEYNLGIICDKCNTECITVVDQPLQSAAWVSSEVMEGIDTLISPIVWIMLKQYLTVGQVSILDWITNPKYRPPVDIPEIERLKVLGIQRGYNNFCRNFDSIIDAIVNGRVVTRKTVAVRKEIEKLVTENRELIFTKYLPIPSKVAFIKEDTSTGSYTDKTMVLGIDAVHTLCSITHSNIELSLPAREGRIVSGLNKLSDYYQTFFKDSLSPKKGWLRKHVYGARLHFSFRGVIASITEPHDYDEVHIPWSMALNVFKTHLSNKLLKLGYTPNETLRIIKENTLKYDPLIDSLLRELIDEAPEGGISILLGRNPTLTRGSVVALRVTDIITDVTVKSIRISVLILAAMNADFDGDALNGFIIPDNKMIARVKRLSPHLYTLDGNIPRTISGFLALPIPVTATMSNFINDTDYLARIGL